MIKKSIFILMSLFLASCGFNGNQKITANDSKHKIEQAGESFTYIVVNLEFIEQVRRICEDSFIASNFGNEELYKQAIAQCTLDNLDLLDFNIGKTMDFQDQYCDGTEKTGDVEKACSYLGR